MLRLKISLLQLQLRPKMVQLVIFGGTGDLSRTKLIPGLYKLYKRGSLPEQLSVLGLARSFSRRKAYLQSLEDSMQQENPEIYEQESWAEFIKYLDYMQIDFTKDIDYNQLHAHLNDQDGSQAGQHCIYYLATAPNFFPMITEKLKEHRLSQSKETGWPRLVIEKPFGYSLESARSFRLKLRALKTGANITIRPGPSGIWSRAICSR